MAPHNPEIGQGDYVKLGPTALEKHYVLAVFGDGTVRLRQASTGKVRNVQSRRCVVVMKAPTTNDPVAAPQASISQNTITREYAETHWCEQCGDFLTWCPNWKDRIAA